MTMSARSQSVDDTLESGVIRKLMWRIIPFIIACYFMSFLNRVNIGFAALTMNKDLGLTSEMFGVAAGIFFHEMTDAVCEALGAEDRDN